MATYTFIASNVLSSAASTISLTSIPSTYTDLVCVFSLRQNFSGANWAQYSMQFNSSSSNQTTRHFVNSAGGIGSSTQSNFISQGNSTLTTANSFSIHKLYIPNYAGSHTKSFSLSNFTTENSATILQYEVAGQWVNNTAINRIDIIGDLGTFVAQSSVYLYGITKL